MFMYTVINAIVVIVFIAVVAYLLFRVFCRIQGDERVIVLVNRRSAFKVEDISFNQLTLVADIPFKNVGRQNGTIMDFYPRHLLPQEQFDSVHVESWITDAREERRDGYWKAAIITPGTGDMLRLRVILTGTSGNIRTDAKDFPNMSIDLVYQMVGRTDWYITKARIILTQEEVQRALQQ